MSLAKEGRSERRKDKMIHLRQIIEDHEEIARQLTFDGKLSMTKQRRASPPLTKAMIK